MIKIDQKEAKKHNSSFAVMMRKDVFYFKCIYLSGSKELDEYLETENAINDCIKVDKNLIDESRKKIQGEEARIFSITFGKTAVIFKKRHDPENQWIFKLPYDEIKTLIMDTKFEIKEEAKGSVIGRGVAGAVLFGPVGAMLGGLSATGTKQVEAMKGLFLTINQNDHEEPIVFYITHDLIQKISETDLSWQMKSIRKKLGDKLQRA